MEGGDQRERGDILIEGRYSEINAGICDYGLKLLSQCQSLIKVRKIDLRNNNISAEGMRHFKKLWLPALNELNLSDNSIANEGIKMYLDTFIAKVIR